MQKSYRSRYWNTTFLASTSCITGAGMEWLSSWLVEQEVQGSNPSLTTFITYIGYLLLPSCNMIEILYMRLKSSKHRIGILYYSFSWNLICYFPGETLNTSQRKEVLKTFYKKMVGTYFSSVVPGSELGKGELTFHRRISKQFLLSNLLSYCKFLGREINISF